MPSLTIRCDTIEKANLLKDILEKTINEGPNYMNREDAMFKIFDFYLKNYKKSKRTRELINRSEHYKREAWKNKIIEEINIKKIRKHEKMKANLIIKLKETIELILRG